MHTPNSQWPHQLPPDQHWHRLTPRWLNTGLILRKNLVSMKETWEIGTPAPPRAELPGLHFLHAFSLQPRTPLASFPDFTASPTVLSELVGQAGMQQTIFTLVALAACVALHTSEGEWGHLLAKPSVDGVGVGGNCLPRWSWKRWRIASNLEQVFDLFR